MGCCCPCGWTGTCCAIADASWFMALLSSSPEIEKSKDEDPHEVDEMPVKAGDLDRRIVARPVIVAAQHFRCDDQQDDDADRHMQSVKAGDHEEACAELR